MTFSVIGFNFSSSCICVNLCLSVVALKYHAYKSPMYYVYGLIILMRLYSTGRKASNEKTRLEGGNAPRARGQYEGVAINLIVWRVIHKRRGTDERYSVLIPMFGAIKFFSSLRVCLSGLTD